MTKENLIKRTLTVLSKLPPDKASEVADFADYILKKYDDDVLQKGIEKMIETSASYEFLRTEEDLYTVSDLKESYK